MKPLAKSSKTQSKKYNFIQYEKYGYARKPAISIWSGDRIHINRAMLTKFKLLNAKRVLLFFDDNNKAIGIRFIDEKRKDAFALTGHTNGRMVHAQSFFKHCGLKITRSQKYPPNFSRELGLFVVDLLRTNEGKCPKCKRMLASNGPFCGGNTCVHPKCNKSKSRNLITTEGYGNG